MQRSLGTRENVLTTTSTLSIQPTDRLAKAFPHARSWLLFASVFVCEPLPRQPHLLKPLFEELNLEFHEPL